MAVAVFVVVVVLVVGNCCWCSLVITILGVVILLVVGAVLVVVPAVVIVGVLLVFGVLVVADVAVEYIAVGAFEVSGYSYILVPKFALNIQFL